MQSKLKSLIGFVLVGLLSCENSDTTNLHLDEIAVKKYYENEIIPSNYLTIYGKWKLFKVSGGIAGIGYEPDYDYLEMKSIGIYGLVKNNILFEQGRIELDTFDHNTNQYLQIKLIPEYSTGLSSGMYPPEKYIELNGMDTLNLNSPCCDLYNYHYKRIH